MIQRKRGLGRNSLEALLSSEVASQEQETDALENTSEPSPEASLAEESRLKIQEVPLSDLVPNPNQPRKSVEKANLEALCASVKTQGILQPLLVKKGRLSPYEIIAGERRFQAAKLAGLTSVPVIVKEVPQTDAMVIALVENIQRENLNPIEEALALEKIATQFNLTHTQVAEMVGKSRASVSNLIRLLSLEAPVKGLLEEGKIDLGHAKVLLVLSGSDQLAAAERIVEKGLSVRETEKLVVALTQSRKVSKGGADESRDADMLSLENRISEVLAAVVKIDHKPSGKGKLTIKYNSLDELEGILAHIK